MPSRERKQEYFTRMEGLIEGHKSIMIVHADHVGSAQFQIIRKSLREKATVLMGKNTMMRRCIQTFLQRNPEHPIQSIVPYIEGNIGLIFTNGDLTQIREVIDENRVPAAARVGVVAECDVIVPPGPTGCDPGQTSWFQALNVPTKISRGQIEIVSELKLITKGTKVGGSEAALLQKLNIRPFTYGLVITNIYNDGAIFAAAVLDLTDDDLKKKFLQTVRTSAAISLEVGFPTIASLPHSIGGAAKKIIALAGTVGGSWKFEAFQPWAPLLGVAAEEKEEAPAEEEAAAAEE